MAKAEPWEKHSFSNQVNRKHVLTVMAIHSLHREENKDIKKFYNELDPKRMKRYMEILSDSVPKNINVHDMDQKRKAFVDKQWMDHIAGIREVVMAAAHAAGAVAPADEAADPAAAGDRPDYYADSDAFDDYADSDHE